MKKLNPGPGQAKYNPITFTEFAVDLEIHIKIPEGKMILYLRAMQAEEKFIVPSLANNCVLQIKKHYSLLAPTTTPFHLGKFLLGM